MDPTEYNEKASSQAVQSNPPSQDPTETAFAHFRQSSTSDKLWHLTQVPALFSSVLVVISSSYAYFTSKATNCDGNSPYSQALLSGVYALLLSMNAYLYANRLREAGKELDGSNTLSPQARRTRRQRIPVLLTSLAGGQYLAAVAVGLAAYRTLRAPLEVGSVCVAAFVGMISCLAAGTYDISLAISLRRRPSWKDTHVSTDDKPITSKQPTSLCDVNLTQLPTFDKHWAATHALALVTYSSAAATSAALLWQTPCEDATRKPLMALSKDCFTHYPSMMNLLLAMVQMWLLRVTSTVPAQGTPRFMYILMQLYGATAGLSLGMSAYGAPGISYGLMLVKVQMAAAAAAFWVCAGYDFALMLKTNFNAPPPNDADALEKDVEEQNEQFLSGP